MKDRYFKFLLITIVIGVVTAIVAPAKAAAEIVASGRPVVAANHPHHHHHGHHYRHHRHMRRS